ncbi:MAG: SDR family oxidoreductase [Candidatus Obscuribacterales bacterium]|nr:SDR family oxidoreductase [Candidatus Obscuribacterales bacterium]
MEEAQKNILVLGANGGLGSSVCRLLQSRKYNLVLAGRNKSALESLSEELGSPFIICDATDFASLASCFEDALMDLGRLDGVVNAVGSLHLKPAHTTTEEDWMSVLQTNLTSSFGCVKYGAKCMMAKGGSIVLVSSAVATTGMPNHEAIAAAKGGVAALARSAAATYARHNLRVNCVSPGMMATQLTRSITANASQLEASTQMHPLGRIGVADDVAPVIEWLLSDSSSWVTGTNINVDGGLASLRGRVMARATS